MANSLQLMKLGELLMSLKTGLNPRDNFKLNTPDAENWYITVRELNGLGVDFLSQTDRVNNHGLKLINNRSNLEVGDVLFSGTGTIGKTAIIDKKPTNWNIKEGVYALKPKKDRLDSYYLMYYLKHLNKMNVFSKISAGSTVFSVPMRSLEELKIQIHNPSDQIKIAKVLKTLDFKIELNNRINAELEAMAKTIYDYWFVQFDFPDKNGKPYKSSGGKMVWNDDLKRLIPEGWQVRELRSEIEIQRGVSYTSKEIEGDGISMINLNSFNLDGTYKPEGVKSYSGKFSDKNLVFSGDLLIAATDVTRNADIIGRAILVPDYYKENLVFSMDVAKISSKNIPASFLMMLFNSNHYHNYIKWFANGTLVLHLNLDGVNRYMMEMPPQSLLVRFNELYLPIANRIYNTAKENNKLTEIRDWLLPMLMNGQVSVN
jgi:type I restriction enzyme S subunit